MPEKLNYRTAVNYVKQAMRTKPADYAYTPPEGRGGSCVNFYDDAPSCIVGHVYSYMGYTEDDFIDKLNDTVTAVVDTTSVEMTDKALYFLQMLQRRQDSGEFTWFQSYRQSIRLMYDKNDYQYGGNRDDTL